MDFNDVIFTRRSVRKYLPRAVEKEKLEAVLKAGVYAPTAMNNRNRKFVAVTKPELLSRLNAAVEKSADEATVERIRSRNDGRFDFSILRPSLFSWRHRTNSIRRRTARAQTKICSLRRKTRAWGLAG